MSVVIIAEAGVNHNGSYDQALKLVDAAVDAGADYVKFQLFKAETLVTKNAKKAEYQVKNTKDDSDQYSMLKKLELSFDQHVQLANYCKDKKIGFMSSAFDIDGLKELRNLSLDFFKIPSGEINNYPYLKEVGSYNVKIVLSTGMSTLDDIKLAVEVLVKSGTRRENITILHCNTEYPTPYLDVNLKAMVTIKDELETEVGYSDHTLGIEVSVAAVALGAKVIEKHFTLDKNMNGPDHKASLNVQELKTLVNSIRNIEKALGSSVKNPSESEKKNIAIARKSIVAKKNISKGDIFTEDNLTTKRPGDGISPMVWDRMIGTISKRNYLEDEKIEE